MNDIYVTTILKLIEVEGNIFYVPDRFALGNYYEPLNEFYELISKNIINGYKEAKQYNCDICFNGLVNLENFNHKFLEHANINSLKYGVEEDGKLVFYNANEINDLYGVDIYQEILEYETKDVEILFEINEEIEDEDIDEIKDTPKNTKEMKELMKLNELIDEINSEIIGQEEAVKKLTTIIYKNLYFPSIKKTNVLLYGKSGMGKTAICQSIGKKLNLPIVIENMASYTQTGYVGPSVSDILVNLYKTANNNLELAEHGVVILDEIDKKASRGNEDEVSRRDVLNELLKIVEGGDFNINVSQYKTVKFNTSNLTFIASGAFSDMVDKKADKVVGFDKTSEIIKKSYGVEDFINYGLNKEFIGRFTEVVKLNELTKSDYLKILKESTISPVKEYLKAFELSGKPYNMDESDYNLIVNEAIKQDIGARALHSATSKYFEKDMYELLCNEGSTLIMKK